MPGQTGSEVRQRTIAYATRWTPVEFARLTEIADYSGYSRAEVLRQLVASDQRNIIPSRELTRQVLRIGNNLNQLTRELNQGRPVQGSALNELYREMFAALIELRR